jgi:cysteine synthase
MVQPVRVGEGSRGVVHDPRARKARRPQREARGRRADLGEHRALPRRDLRRARLPDAGGRPNKIPLEKKVLLKIAGANLDVVNDELCPSPSGGDGSINLAKTYAKAQADRWVLPNQYENEANVLAHYHGTGPEIWSQTEGRVTHLFVSLGTCGTVTGCSRFLKERNPKVKVVAVQPTEGHDVPGLRNLSQLEVSKLFEPALVDDILEIDFTLAYERAAELARTEGLLAGPSSGLILEGARRIVERDRSGVGVLIFPDNVFKYVSNMSKHLPGLLEGTTP